MRDMSEVFSLASSDADATPPEATRPANAPNRTGRHYGRAISAPLLCGALAALDACAIAAAGILALLAYADTGYIAQQWMQYLSLSVAGGAGTVLLAHTVRLYRADTLATPFLRPWQVIGCWVATLLLLLGGVFFLHAGDGLSRGWVGCWLVIGTAGLAAVRLGLRARMAIWRARGRMARPVVVIGNAASVPALMGRLGQPALADFFRVTGVLYDGAPPQGALPPQVTVMQTASELLDFIRARGIETAMICFGSQPGTILREVSLALADLPLDVVLYPDPDCFPLPVTHARQVGGMSLLQVSRPPLGDWARIAKGLEDRIVAACMLAALAPVMLAAAAWIKWDSPGPVMFRQPRWGFNNRVITVLKFRTMHTKLGDVSGAQRTVRGDPRVTRAGRWLRASSIDELPQLINVLRGEMSLVGPRAHPITMRVADQLYHEAVDGYVARHRVKPGMTGLAQINGCRGEVSTMDEARKRVRYDLEYAARWSLWLDLKILLLTPVRALHKVY